MGAAAPAAEALGDATPSNLRAELTSFVGRERELGEVVAALGGTRILTLTGPGGSGKTRLAGRAAREALDRHPGGAWWVELAPVADPGLVGAAVARAVGVRPLPGERDIDAVAAFLSERRALVVLDNCEHLLDECARAAETLARGCPGVTVLATSRAPLRAAGETEWRVPPLSLPAGPGDGAAGSDAVRLFADRAAQVRPGFPLTEADAPAVARICRELDGMPLAIELAAARLRSLSPGQIADGLSDRFRLLTRGARTALPRHRTLRASVDWSHDLLAEGERVALRRLGVFAGGFTAEAAERVCAGDATAGEDVPDLVASLVEHSLLQVEDQAGVARYRMLETVRQYALERLEAAGETATVRAAHRDAYLDLAERLAPRLLTPEQPAVLAALDAEAANLAHAVDHAAETAPDIGLRLCGALAVWWRLRGLFAHARTALDRALAAAPGPSLPRARALWTRAYLLSFAGDFAAAVPVAEQARAEAVQLGDRLMEGRAEMVLGKCALMLDPPPVSRERLRRAVDLARGTGDDLGLMHAAQALGFGYAFGEEHGEAGRHFADVLPVVERTGHHEFLANHWAARGWGEYAAGRLAPALDALERAVAAARTVEDTVTEAGVTAYVACVLADRGDPHAALGRLAPVHGRALAQGAGFLLPLAEVAMARVRAAAGDLEPARGAFEALLGGPAGRVRYARTWALADLAETLRLLGDGEAAAVAALSARASAEDLGNAWFRARAELVLGRLSAGRGEWADAERLLHEALATFAGAWHRLCLPTAIEAIAAVLAGRGAEEDAARALGAARRLRAEAGTVPWRPAQAELDALAARLAGALGEAALGDRLAEGAALDGDAAVAWLRRGRGSRRRPPGGWESLTPTELEVVRHAAAGLTNPEIARRMFVSRATVKAHLAHVYAKLGVRNRADLAREAARRPAGIGRAPAGR